jgi:RNA polymerase sigma-70 factor, ECF subfamily
MPRDPGPATLLLLQARSGDSDAGKRLVELLYRDLRGLAGSYLSGDRARMTLQPTALVHEVYLKLAAGDADAHDREHFLALAATAMRQVLADHARARGRQKRGGDRERVTFHEDAAGAPAEVDVSELDELLEALRGHDERMHRIVELRYFGGLTIEECARVLGFSTTTIENEWRLARAWLAVRLAR